MKKEKLTKNYTIYYEDCFINCEGKLILFGIEVNGVYPFPYYTTNLIVFW